MRLWYQFIDEIINHPFSDLVRACVCLCQSTRSVYPWLIIRILTRLNKITFFVRTFLFSRALSLSFFLILFLQVHFANLSPPDSPMSESQAIVNGKAANENGKLCAKNPIEICIDVKRTRVCLNMHLISLRFSSISFVRAVRSHAENISRWDNYISKDGQWTARHCRHNKCGEISHYVQGIRKMASNDTPINQLHWYTYYYFFAFILFCLHCAHTHTHTDQNDFTGKVSCSTEYWHFGSRCQCQHKCCPSAGPQYDIAAEQR